MNADERSDLLAQLTAQQEQLAECRERLASYIEVVSEVVERLGHEGSEPNDLLDAFGEIEGMLLGKITNEPHDLAGLAEVCRQALWHRDRARSLLADARETCDRRAAERDTAILERDAAARELVRLLARQQPSSTITSEMIKTLHEQTQAAWRSCKEALNATGGDMESAADYLRKKGLA